MKLFISYARADAAVAEALVQDLAALGHDAYIDERLYGGDKWWDTLLNQIQASQAFVPVLSDDYRGSQACTAEAEWAASLGIPFLPVRTSELFAGWFDPVIAEANWVRYDPESRAALAELARALGSVQPIVLPDPLPERPPIPLSYLVTTDREIRGDQEIGRQRQLIILSDLRSRLDSKEAGAAHELLRALRRRPDVTYEVAVSIDGLLSGTPPDPPPAPEPDPPNPEPPPRRQPELPRPDAVRDDRAGEPEQGPDAPPAVPTDPAPARAAPRAGAIVASALDVGSVVLLALGLFGGPWLVESNSGTTVNTTLSKVADGVLPTAAVAVSVCLAIALAVQFRHAALPIRIAGALLQAVVLVMALVGATGARDDGQSLGWGVWVLTVGLALLIVATLLPNGHAPKPSDGP